MSVDLAELRRDVREALENGRKRVELVYADKADYNAALTAMRGDGWRVTTYDGVICVTLPQGAAL